MATPTVGWLVGLGINVVVAYLILFLLFLVVSAPFKLTERLVLHLYDKDGAWKYIGATIVIVPIALAIWGGLHLILP